MSSLNALNYLNVAAYVINAAVVFGIDYTGLPSNPQVSAQFPTLITPAGFAFAIWSIIFMSQAIYVIVQLLPPYRNTPLVQEGVGYNYVGACVAQATWAVLFAFEMIPLSAVAMVAILYFLARIVRNQHSIRTKSDSEATYEPVQSGVLDFWFLVFPFAIHGAWIVVAAFVNISIVLVFYGASANLQFGLAIVSLILLVLAGAEALLKTDEPNYTAAVVFAWALVSTIDTTRQCCQLISDEPLTRLHNTHSFLPFFHLTPCFPFVSFDSVCHLL